MLSLWANTVVDIEHNSKIAVAIFFIRTFASTLDSDAGLYWLPFEAGVRTTTGMSPIEGLRLRPSSSRRRR